MHAVIIQTNVFLIDYEVFIVKYKLFYGKNFVVRNESMRKIKKHRTAKQSDYIVKKHDGFNSYDGKKHRLSLL